MKLETERDADELMRAAKALAVVSAWSGAGIFEKLRAGATLIAELPGDPRAIAVSIPVLAHLGLLVDDGHRVALTAPALRLLESGGMPTAQNLEWLKDLSKMTDVIKGGGPVKDDQGVSKGTLGGTKKDDLAHTERFLEMLYRFSEEPAKETFAWLSPRLTKGGSVLDLGGGHGRYARAFSDAGFAVTLFDQPDVVGLARKRHGDAMKYLEGDFHQVDSFGGPYDLVLMANIVHGESAKQNASIIERAAQSLRPGGTLAVKDMFLDEHRQNPASAVFFGLTMLFYTAAGKSPTVADIKDWFQSAGLAQFEFIALDAQQLACARLPG